MNYTINSFALENRLKKQQAFDFVKKLKQGEVLSDNEIDLLLCYFIPPLPTKAKTAEQWVAKAVAINDIRVYLNYLYVKGGIAMCTDGHRAHRAPTKLEDGWYEPKSLLKVEDLDYTYPNLDKIFPTSPLLDSCQLESMEAGIATTARDKTITYKRIPDGMAVNSKYLTEAVNREQTGPIYFHNESNKFHGRSEFGEWVVAALRI